MRILLAVIDDLFQFARTLVFGVFVFNKNDIQSVTSTLPKTETNTQFLLNAHKTPALLEQVIHTELDTPDNLSSQVEVFFVGVTGSYLYINPVVAFDTASMPLMYGEIVYMITRSGRWAQVCVRNHEGWVFKDMLKEQAVDVFPYFTDGLVYDFDNIQTQKIRLCINDEFMGTMASLPLSDAEYVAYRMYRLGKKIPWSLERPRIAGTWQKKLRGEAGVHIGIVPKTSSIMEYIIDDVGHLCFVESVFPDKSLKISSAGIYEDGMYSELIIQKDDLKELKPVFIEVA